ncbi:MAG: hypothetical protein WCP96_01575 [Methylococcaceae bacterium]
MEFRKREYPIQAEHETALWKINILWASVAFVFLVLMLGVAPGRGAGWVVDDGLFLSSAFNAANGFGLDKMLPQEPGIYLFNALLIKLGMVEYLHFRYVYYILNLLSSAVFFLGLDHRRFRSPAVPVAIFTSLLVAFSSILVSDFFFLLGAGCYFFAIDAPQRKRATLLALSGILFAVTGFMHAAFVIAMSVLIGFALLIDKSLRKSLLWPCFILGTLLIWGGYIYCIGVDNLLVTPAGHDASAGHLLLNVGRILWTYLVVVLAYLLTVRLFKKRGQEKFAAAQFLLSVLVTVFYGIEFYGAQFASYYSDKVVPWLGLDAHVFRVLHNDLRQVVHVPGAIYYLLLFAIFCWLGEGWSAIDRNQRLGNKKNSPAPTYLLSGVSNIYVTTLKLFTSLDWNSLNGKLTLAAIGLSLLVSGYATGSASSLAICMSAFSGPAIGLVIIFWASPNRQISHFTALLLTVWIGIFVLFALTINLPTFEPIFTRNRIMLEDTPLKGILVQPRYARSVVQLREEYKANKCQELTLIALEYIPTVYYLLQHSAPNSIGVVRPGVYFPEDRIRTLLNLQGGWCVIDATTKDTKTEIERNHGLDNRETIRILVKNNADRVFTISSPSEDIDDLRLYIRDARKF